MGCHELREDFREANLVIEGADSAVAALGPPREEGGEGVDVVVVDLANVGVGDYDVGEVAEGLDAVGEADREKGEGEVCRGEERLFA